MICIYIYIQDTGWGGNFGYDGTTARPLKPGPHFIACVRYASVLDSQRTLS